MAAAGARWLLAAADACCLVLAAGSYLPMAHSMEICLQMTIIIRYVSVSALSLSLTHSLSHSLFLSLSLALSLSRARSLILSSWSLLVAAGRWLHRESRDKEEGRRVGGYRRYCIKSKCTSRCRECAPCWRSWRRAARRARVARGVARYYIVYILSIY